MSGPAVLVLVALCGPCDVATEARPEFVPDTCPLCAGPVIIGEIDDARPGRL